MNKIFILEDDKNRMELFRRNLGKDPRNYITWAKNIQQAKNSFCPPYNMILLDHDLGDEIFASSDEENTGAGFVRWATDNFRPSTMGTIIIHSWNTVGARNMKEIIGDYKTNVTILPFGPTLLTLLRESNW